MVRAALALEGGCAVLEELFLPAVGYRRLQPQFLTQIGNWHFVQQVPSQDGNLLFSRVMLSLFFPCVLSAILTEERPLQFQLRQDKCWRLRVSPHGNEKVQNELGDLTLS